LLNQLGIGFFSSRQKQGCRTLAGARGGCAGKKTALDKMRGSNVLGSMGTTADGSEIRLTT